MATTSVMQSSACLRERAQTSWWFPMSSTLSPLVATVAERKHRSATKRLIIWLDDANVVCGYFTMNHTSTDTLYVALKKNRWCDSVFLPLRLEAVRVFWRCLTRWTILIKSANNFESITSLMFFHQSYVSAANPVPPPRLPRSADTIPPFNRCCLSCEITCGYVDVSFSHNMQYFLLYCKGERTPTRLLPVGLRGSNWISALYGASSQPETTAGHLQLERDVNVRAQPSCWRAVCACNLRHVTAEACRQRPSPLDIVCVPQRPPVMVFLCSVASALRFLWKLICLVGWLRRGKAPVAFLIIGSLESGSLVGQNKGCSVAQPARDLKFITAFLFCCVGPQVPSVAIYSTEGRQSECQSLIREGWRPSTDGNRHILFNPQRCSTWRGTRGWTKHATKCRCPEWRTRPSSSTITVFARPPIWLLRHTVSSGHVIVVNPLLSVVALTMQILKPAGFVDTAHYPLLLLVYVWEKRNTTLQAWHIFMKQFY